MRQQIRERQKAFANQRGIVICRDIRQARTTEKEKAKDSEKERARQIRADLEPADSDDEDYWVRQPYASR